MMPFRIVDEQGRCSHCGWSGRASETVAGADPNREYCPKCKVGVFCVDDHGALDPAASAPVCSGDPRTYQNRVDAWMQACFGPEISADVVERCHRFLEEALELVQACGGTTEDAHKLVDYVFNRPVGEVNQEVSGVSVTLAALCNTMRVDITDAAEKELARIWTKVEAIRKKQATKPKGSPLPQAQYTSPAPSEAYRLARIALIIEMAYLRAQCSEGPVPLTLQGMEQEEISAIYALANGKPETWRPSDG